MKDLYLPMLMSGHQPPNPPPLVFKQSVVECFRCQTKLKHSTQCLHQQTTDALENITKSSSLQENQHFINDIPIFKPKDPSMFSWLARAKC